MNERREARSAVLTHSAAGLAFFLGLAFLPRLIPSLLTNPLFFWICVVGAVVSFLMTNLAERGGRRGAAV